MKRISLLLLLGLAVGGCAGSEMPSPMDRMQVQQKASSGSKPQAPAEAPLTAVDASGVALGGQQAEAAKTPEVARKIIRTGTMGVVVEDFDKAVQELETLLKGVPGAYIAQADVRGSGGTPRSGTWRVRLPTVGFDTFMDAVARLGIPEVRKVDTEDVTEQYYDLEAHIKNKKTEESRLLKILEEATGKLQEVLSVERELSRVRGEIEAQEGRLRVLANLTSLTTVNVSIREVKNYVPPRSPTFGNQIATTFSGSINALVALGKGIVIVAVALAPWLPFLLLIAAGAWLLLRRRNRPILVVPERAP